jgi:hypothetical protein
MLENGVSLIAIQTPLQEQPKLLLVVVVMRQTVRICDCAQRKVSSIEQLV